ncbi:hypothetical protein [Enterococcus bulliens]
MEEYDIMKYLNLDFSIKYLEVLQEATSHLIYEQTLATHIAYDELGIHAKAPKVEHIVSDNVEACELIKRRLKRLKEKQVYFTRFMNELTQRERESILSGTMNENIKEKVLDEIYEIETAISLKYDLPPIPPKEERANLITDIDMMLGAFAI